MKRLYLLLLILVISLKLEICSQEIIEIEPLFEYPVAPEEMESLEDRCNYIISNFWNQLDFKRKTPVDQHALNEAFNVYTTAFRYASPKERDQSIDKLLKNLSSNPILLLEFCKAAEENLYGPRANIWSDIYYMKFLDAVIKNKKVPANRKQKYQQQLTAMKNSEIGNIAPSFWFLDKERASKQYFPMSTPTLLIFGNPDDTDWRLARLKMDSDYQLEDALKKGKINILYIIPTEQKNWTEMVSNYNSYWTVGQSEEVKNIYDIRINPAIYLVGSDGKILKKNISPSEAAVSMIEIIK